MAYIIKSNPDGCWKKDKPASCYDCYCSKVKNNQWTGSQKCFNAGCIVYGGMYSETKDN